MTRGILAAWDISRDPLAGWLRDRADRIARGDH